MTELSLRADSWSLTYNYQFFLVKRADYTSFFFVNRTDDDTIKQQYDFTSIVKSAAEGGVVQIVLDNKGKLDFVEFALVEEDAAKLVDFLTTATASDSTPHTTEQPVGAHC